MKVKLLSHTPSEEIQLLTGDALQAREMLQHASFTFAVEGVSRACSHQLVRHRVASFSQQSQRYIPVHDLGGHVVTPPSVQRKCSGEFESFIEETSQAYSRLVEGGVPREDARFVLPNAAETSMLLTLDGRSLLHFFGLRLCSRAQWEVRALAEEMLRQVREAEPALFKAAGPYCVQRGGCTEGRFSCGRAAEMLEKYRV